MTGELKINFYVIHNSSKPEFYKNINIDFFFLNKTILIYIYIKKYNILIRIIYFF